MPLKVSDGMGAWIDDFQKSDAPQFKGKNKEERREMAIAAYLDAKRGPQKEARAPKMTYALVGAKDMKIYSIGSDERDLKLDRRSLEKRFKQPLKLARLKTAQSIGDKVDKSQIKENIEENKARQSADLAKAMAAFKKRGGKVKKVAPGKAAGYHGKDDPGAGVHGMMDRPDTKGMPRRKKVRSLRAGVEESIDEAKDASMVNVLKVMGPTKNAKEGIAAIKRVFKVNDKKAEELLDKAIKHTLGEELNEVSIDVLNRYYKMSQQSRDKAVNSAIATILRKGDHSKDLNTRRKREAGMKMAKSRAVARLRGESVNEEMMFKVSVEGLPPMIMLGRSPGDIKGQLRKIVKQPSMITDVERMTKADVRKRYRDMAKGDGDEEA